MIAIAITLLVLSIDVPNLELEPAEELEGKLLDLWPDLLAYALSFAVIGRYWIVHHRFFATLERYDSGLVALNLIFLAWIVLIPFTSELLGEFGDEEAAVIAREHGAHLIYRTRWGEWRTRVRNRRCVFFAGGGCTLHDKPYYPAVCAGFPWTDAETGGVYEFDVTICPQLAADPALIARGRQAVLDRLRAAHDA